jgi:hypothetical protein
MSEESREEGVADQPAPNIIELYNDDVHESNWATRDSMYCPVCDQETTKLLDVDDEVDDGMPLCPRCFGNWLAAEGATVVLPDQ